MKRYPEYKDSGMEWIGEIPSHWKQSRFKYESLVPVQYGLNISPDFYIKQGIRFIRTTDITDDGKLIDKGVYLEEESVEKIYLTQPNDLLISRSGTLGKTYLHQSDEKCTYGGYLVRFNFGCSVKSRFIFYFTKSRCFEHWIALNTVQSTIGNVNGQKYANLKIPLPSSAEQTQIVNFLDRKTEQIDELIRIKERMVELLQEQRTALVHETVTKGLDPNVEMKPSGVEWIGDIPAHWEIGKIKYIATLISQKSTPETDTIKISPENVESETGKVLDFYSTYDSVGVKFQAGDVLFNKLRVYLSKVVFAEYSGYSLGEMIVIRPALQDTGKYLFYLMLSPRFIAYCDSISYGVKMPRTSVDDILNAQIPLASYQEQTQIANFLNHKTAKIDELRSNEQRSLELLKEYRHTLISEVVTGKLDVRSEV